jgi:hypothetical protein
VVLGGVGGALEYMVMVRVLFSDMGCDASVQVWVDVLRIAGSERFVKGSRRFMMGGGLSRQVMFLGYSFFDSL